MRRQDEENRHNSTAECGLQVFEQLNPESLKNVIVNQSGRIGPVVHTGNDFPIVIAGGLKKAIHRRVVAQKSKYIPTARDLKRVYLCRLINERVGLMKETGKENPRLHQQERFRGGGRKSDTNNKTTNISYEEIHISSTEIRLDREAGPIY
ncbi:MAG: hypothetical protein WCN98_18470 [Verrucomicrobiaceae bacterium]